MELIDKIKAINNLTEINNLSNIDTNEIILAIIQTKRFDLLQGHDIKLNPNNKESFGRMANTLLSSDYIFDLKKYNFSLSQEDVNALFSIIKNDYDSSRFYKFFEMFYDMENLLNTLITENKDYFRNYLKLDKTVPFLLKNSDSFINIIIEEKRFDLIDLVNNITNYSPNHLKMIAEVLRSEEKTSSKFFRTSNLFVQRLFETKESYNDKDFYTLLSLLKDRGSYDNKVPNSNDTTFSNVVNENFDFLLNMLDGKEFLPKCLAESTTFRDECIRRNRFDYAVQCVLPSNILENNNVLNGYAQALNISPMILHSRLKQIDNYYKKNNNIFNSILGTSLKSGIFNMKETHFERFVNDVDIQQSLAKLNDQQLKVVSKILEKYSFKDYDLSSMITNIVNNIHSYNQLINGLDIDNLTDGQFIDLVQVLQIPNNPYNTKNLSDLENYTTEKKKRLTENFSTNSLEVNKNQILQILFNIDLKEANHIYAKFCHSSEMLENLKDSELPKENLEQLLLIDKIVHCNDNAELARIYNELKGTPVYKSDIPFRTYLKSVYTRLYSEALYDPKKRDQVYGPKEHTVSEDSYNGKKVQIYVPKANFNFLVHAVGTCSNKGDAISSNYAEDWLGRPQMQDHYVSCSYINEKQVFSLRDQNSIIYGFDQLEDGSMLLMGNGDIDAIGPSVKYDGARDYEENHYLVKYFVPSELTKASSSKGYGYNEIVLERRDETKNQAFAKRKPNYVIMPVNSMKQDCLNTLDKVFQKELSFISKEDQLKIATLSNHKDIEKVLIKYKETIRQLATEKSMELKSLAYQYIDLIMTAQRYEECLKASSEFDIPLVIIDREFYFKKMLAASTDYSKDIKPRISDYFDKLLPNQKKDFFNYILQGKDVSHLFPTPTDDQDQLPI